MKVKFLPQNIELEIKPNQSVLDLAQEHGIYIQSVCKGIPSCAECRVHIEEGERNMVPPLAKELELIGTAYFVDQRRLSCQIKCFGDIIVDLSEQIEKSKKSTKNPQGRYVKEKEDSKARMGNILDESEKKPDENSTSLSPPNPSLLTQGVEENVQQPPSPQKTQRKTPKSLNSLTENSSSSASSKRKARHSKNSRTKKRRKKK